jgi:hypothetical protein
MRNAVDRYMHDEDIRFSHSIVGFHYLGRKHGEVLAHEFRMDVRGPRFEA